MRTKLVAKQVAVVVGLRVQAIAAAIRITLGRPCGAMRDVAVLFEVVVVPAQVRAASRTVEFFGLGRQLVFAISAADSYENG